MATLTAIRPAEAIPVMRMAIQRTTSISEIVVDSNARTHAEAHLRVACIAANPILAVTRVTRVTTMMLLHFSCVGYPLH